jgi:ferredoxin
VPLDYEAYAAIGAVVGHGGIVVHDDTSNLAELAAYAMEFCAIESCGKCTPCRIGSTRGVETIARIRNGDTSERQITLLRDLCDTMLAGSLCAMGGMTPYPVLSALDHFPEDFGSPPASRPRRVRSRLRPDPEGPACPSTLRTSAKAAAARANARARAPQRARDPFDETDYGTPQRHADTDVTLEIDGQAVTVPAGTSVMRAAIEAGVNVPKLCATDSLEPFGSCRLCLVEIEGRRGYPASCTTPAEAGMKVRTQSDRLQKLRRNVMELYISDHPLDCLTCPANGDCELQDMAGVVGLREVRYGFDGANHLRDRKDESNPYFTYDPSKCIVCNRCVRACEETQGTFALTIAARGFESRVAAGASESFMASECVSCGACVAGLPDRHAAGKASCSSARPNTRWSPPAPTAASAARSRPR